MGSPPRRKPPALTLLEGTSAKIRKTSTETGVEGNTSQAEPGGEQKASQAKNYDKNAQLAKPSASNQKNSTQMCKEPRQTRTAGQAKCVEPKDQHAKKGGWGWREVPVFSSSQRGDPSSLLKSRIKEFACMYAS